jgi:predicted N-acetyltransferase YhbS
MGDPVGKIVIREEEPNDYDSIFHLVEEAFRTAEHSDHDEQFLMARLRGSECWVPGLATVALIESRIVGYALLTKAFIGDSFECLMLGPIAVAPALQRRGIGRALIADCHARALSKGYTAVVLLGHAWYYPQVGYERLSKFGIKMPHNAPDENSFGIQLTENAFAGVSGVVRYSPLFEPS